MTLPIALKLDQKKVLVIGGGRIALEKVLKLLRHNAQITLIAPECLPELVKLEESNLIQIIRRKYIASDIQTSYQFVICATNDLGLTKEAYQHAKINRILFNAVDLPEYCDFYFTCDYQEDEYTISVATEGRCPMLATYIRDHLITKLKPLYPVFQKLIQYRQDLKKTVSTQKDRAIELRKYFNQALKQHYQTHYQFKPGHVYMLGAGPGNVSLITQRCREALLAADVVFFDELVNKDILNQVAEPCLKIYVGKKGGGLSTTQTSINAQLIQAAHKHQVVVRLKGGNPGVFSRTWDEIIDLRANHIPYAIIPGISAGSAVIEALNLPLTARNIADRIIFLTAYSAQQRLTDFSYLKAHLHQATFVIFMGFKQLEGLIHQFLNAGFPESTRIAILSAITLENQNILVDDIGNILTNADLNKSLQPTIIVIGEILKYYVPTLLTRTECECIE